MTNRVEEMAALARNITDDILHSPIDFSIDEALEFMKVVRDTFLEAAIVSGVKE